MLLLLFLLIILHFEPVTVTDDYGAVSAYFPQNRYANNGLNEDFRTTEWYRAAGWDVAGW